MLMATGASRHDMARFGAEVARPSPRQADLIIVAGAIVERRRVRLLYEQMAEPRYVIATGACSICGGPSSTTPTTSSTAWTRWFRWMCMFRAARPPRGVPFWTARAPAPDEGGRVHPVPDIRRKPVVACLPPGITAEEIRANLLKTAEKACCERGLCAEQDWRTNMTNEDLV